MTAPRIELAGFGKNMTGLTWESEWRLRIGRQHHLEVVLHDSSVDRYHAEIKYHGLRWILRDLARNAMYPTLVNQRPLSSRAHVLRLHDAIQVGKVHLRVIVLEQQSLQEVIKAGTPIKKSASMKETPRLSSPGPVNPERSELIERQKALVIRTVTSLARAAEMRDEYSSDHPKRVTDYALLLADELKLSAIEKTHLQIGAPFHDIGKIILENAILRKPGKLTPIEFEHVKSHTTHGAKMLHAMADLVPMVPIVRHHHECWDGSGYPDGLTHERIPLVARIVSVADTFDAMTSHRPYRAALSVEQAFVELLRKAGTQFDPKCVYAFLRLRPMIEAMMRRS